MNISNPNTIGIITVIIVASGAVFFSIMGMGKLPSSINTAEYIAIFGIGLTFAIFVIQWKISKSQDEMLSKVSDVLEKRQSFEARQTEELVRDIDQWLGFIEDDMKKMEQHVENWKKTRYDLKHIEKTVIESYHQHIRMEIDYLQSPDFLSSHTISQVLKRQLKRLKTSYHTGPMLFPEQNMAVLIELDRIKSVIITIRGLLKTEPNN